MPPAISSSRTILRPPGFGLLTVHTGASAAETFFAKYFRAGQHKKWGQVLESSWRGRRGPEPWILGIPSDSGGGICRGAAHGPLALRREMYARDRSWAQRDFGDVPCIPQLLEDEMLSSAQLARSGQALWGKGYRKGLPVSPMDIAESFLVEAAKAGFRVLTLGGDHSVSWPAFKALHRARKTRRLAVLHLDAHTDLLESRYGIEHCFGTWTARLRPEKAPPYTNRRGLCRFVPAGPWVASDRTVLTLSEAGRGTGDWANSAGCGARYRLVLQRFTPPPTRMSRSAV